MVVVTPPLPVADGPRTLTAAIDAARARQSVEAVEPDTAAPIPDEWFGDDEPEQEAPTSSPHLQDIPADWRGRERGSGLRRSRGSGNPAAMLARLRALDADPAFVGLKPATREVVMRCALRHANDAGEFYVGLRNVARAHYRDDLQGKALANAKRHIRRMLAEAEAAGVIVRVPHSHENGGDVSSTYRLLVAPC